MTSSAYDPELLNSEFTPWETITNDPEYNAAPNQDKLRSFENWSSYARDYTQKKIAEAPEDRKPELVKASKEIDDYISKSSDFLKTKHDLGYRFQKAAEKSNADLLDVVRYPEELIAEGFDPEQVYKLRKAVTDELAPELLRSGSYGLNFATRFGPLVSLAKEQLPGVYESALKQAEVDLWEKPGAFEGAVNSLKDVVGSAIPSLIGQAIVKGAGGALQATSSALKSASSLFYKESLGVDKMPDPRGDDFDAPTVYTESPAVSSFFKAGEDAGKAVGAAGDKIYGGQDSLFTSDPRYGKWQSVVTGAAAQMPGQLGLAAIPVAGPALSMASNTGMMYAENVDQYEKDIKQTLFDEGKKSGSIPETTPFKSWEKNLSQKDLDEVRAKAAAVALPVAIGQGFIEKQVLGSLLSDATLKFLPAPAKAALMRLRYTNPRAAFAARILTNAGIKSPFEGAEESAQEITKNLGSAILTGDFAIDKILKNTGESFVGGLAGGVTATGLTLNQVVRTEKSIDWAQSILNGRNDAIQNDLDVIDGNNKPQESPETPQVSEEEKTKARERLGRLNEEELRHQQDIRIIGAPDADKKSFEFREAQRRAQNRQDAANWIIRQVGGTPEDSVSADRYEKTAEADREYQTALTKHIQDNLPDYKPPLQEFQRQAQETRARFEQLRRDARANGFTQVAEAADAAEKLELERLAINFSNTSEAADKLTQDFIGSVETDGPGRAKFARQQLARMYPNSQFSPWWDDDATVVELLNARETGEIDDDTNLDEWLSSPAGIKAAASESDAGSKAATPPAQKGLMSEDDLLQAFYMAEDNVSNSDDASKKEVTRLWERISKLRSVLDNEGSSEERKAEAAERLPELENALLNIATVSSQRPNPNDQNQTANKAPVPSQEVPPTSAAGQGTGAGEPFTIVRNFDGEEVIQTERDYINESRRIVRALMEGERTPEETLQNVEAVRQEIEAAPDLTPEQKTQWASHFQNIPALAEQQRAQQTTPTTSTAPVASIVPESTGSPELIAGEGTISESPTPARMNSVPGDVLRTESGEVVFRSTADNTETVLRVKEGSIEKDPATLTVEDFEGGDGTPLVSEANKQFSVLPNNERPVRPFFRSEPQSTITPQDGPTATSSGSYPEDAGSTPAPATPAIDTAAITTEVQANPDAHRRTQGRSKQVSREAAVAILTQLPENLTRKDAISIGSTAGMSRPGERVLKLAALRNDPNAVASILNGDMDAELGLFDRNAEPTTPAATEQRNDTPAPKAEEKQTPIEDTPEWQALSEASVEDTPEWQALQDTSEEDSPEWQALSEEFDKHMERVSDLELDADTPRTKVESLAKKLVKAGAISQKAADEAIRLAKDRGYDREDAVAEALSSLNSDLQYELEQRQGVISQAFQADRANKEADLTQKFEADRSEKQDALRKQFAEPAPKAQPTTEVSNDTSTKPADNTPPAETTGQGTVDRFVYNLMGAFKGALSKMNESNLKVMTFRAQMQTEEGRAEIQRKLAGMAQTSIFAGIRSKGILDPVVVQDMAEKALYGTVSSAKTGEVTKNVQQDLLNNLAKTGDPFLTTNKDGDTVSYNAWFARGRNLVDRYIKAQNKRDKGTKNSEGEQDATDVENVASQDPEENALDPKESFKIEQLAQMRADAIREVYDRIAQRLARETGYPLEDARLALLHHLGKIRGVEIDPVPLGWKIEGDTSRVKPNILKVVRAKAPGIFGALEKDMKKALSSVLRAAEEQGLLSAPVIDLNNLTLESLIEASVYDEIVNGQSHKNAIAEAREKNSTSPLMPLLAKIDRKDVVAAVHSVLNNGKPFANARDITALTQSDMQKVLDSGLLPARIQETLQALVDLSGDGMALLQNSKNEGWRRWAELLGEQMGNRAPVQVVFNLALDPAVTGQGLWQESTNTVHVSPFLTREQGLMESTLLHEMMHPIWDWKVTAFQRGDLSQLNKKEVAALTELQDLLGLVKAEADKKLAGITDKAALEIAKRDLLGSTDLREFLNEAINHKPFQDFLAELKDPDAKAKGSLFRRIVNAILKLIRGGDVASDSILQRSFELSLDLANYTDRELPIAERNKTQVEYFKKLEAQRGRSLTPDEAANAAAEFAFKYPQPRIVNTRAEASRLAPQVLTAPELEGFLASQAYMGVSDQQVYDAIKANGGITIDVWTAGQPGTGIVVAPFKETETKIPLNEFKPDDVKAFMRKFRPLLEVPGMHLGGWISDDTVYLDVSVVTEDEVTATALAEDGNQLAVYNIGTGEFPSTPDLLGRNGGAVSRLRAEPRYQNLARSLQQAFGRAMGGIRGESDPDVSRQGAFPEFGIIESLTGQPITRNELGALQESAERVDAGPVPTRAEIRPSRPNAEPNPFVKDGIRGYNSRYGIAPAIEGHYAPVNEQRARDIAAAYEALPVFDKGRETQEAYAKLAEEIQQQWDYAINEMGVTFEEWSQPGQPYANSREMVRDVRDNKHLWFFTGGEPHPLLNQPDQDGLTMNDKLRAIHDLFGHAAEDFQFGARGEENAWIKHSQMFSPLAQKALTTETRGQNSWVNFGPQNYNEDGSKKNISASDRPFAVQKVALLPEEFMDWKGALSSTLASQKVGPEQYLSSATDEVYNFPAPNEYFPNAEAVRAYVDKKFKPQVKALKSWMNDNVLAREAAYVVVGQQGRHYIEFNPYTMTQNTRTEVDAIMREELVHCATGLVLQRKGIEWQDFYEDLGGSLSPQQRERLKGVYRSTRNNVDVGAEYFRAAIQQLLYGRITEAERKTSPMKKILSLIMDFVNFFRKGEVDPVVREVYEDSVRILQKVDKKNAKQDVLLSNAVPEELGRLWREAVAKEGGDAFAYGEVSPEVKSFPDVFKAVLGDASKSFSVGYYSDGNDVTPEQWGNLPSDAPAEIWIKDPKGGVTVFFSEVLSARSGIFAINSAGTKTQGSAMYQALYAWAHNNGKIVGPDSSLSVAGQLRRTSQMLSSALRFGTTQHMKPSYEQGLSGWRNVEVDENGTPWEIILRRGVSGTIDGLSKKSYNEFHQEVSLPYIEAEPFGSDDIMRKSVWNGYEIQVIPMGPEEAREAWNENIGLLAKKEAQLVFERIPDLGSLNISKDGYLFGPDEEYPGSTRALPAGNTKEYIATLLSAISKSDPDFAARVGPATLARALATRFAEANRATPTLLSSNAEGSDAPRELKTFSPFTNTLYSAPVPSTPMPMSALDVLYKDSASLPKPDKKIKNSAVATTLAEAALKYWGFQLNSGNITPEIEQILVSNGVEEFISALQASGKNAADWYSTAIEVAMGVAGVIHPEISDVEIAKSIPAFASAKEPDKAAQLVMRIALAVTSQNLNVNQNAGYAEEQYAIFSSTGKFDSSKIYGEKAESISGNLRLANELITRLGFDGAEDFIKRDFTVDDLQKKASAILGRSIKIAGKLDDSVNGAALFGPKIGQGFLQNLMGRFTPVTIDLWMRRTWGRWTGDVVGDGVTDERMARLLDSARDAGLQLPEDLRTLRTVERKRQNGNPFKTMSSSVSDRLETDPEFRKSVENLAFEFNSKGQAEYRLSGQPVTPEQAAAIAKYNTPEWKVSQEKAYLAAIERGEEKEAQKIQEEAERARTKFVRDQQRVKEKLDQTWKDLSAAGKKPRMPKADWVAAQHQEAGRTEVLDKEVRKFLKPEWSRNAKVIVADLNPVDIPSPQDRRVITRVVNKIREELSNKGYTATNADVQAVLWYPEKDVWAKLRGEEESNLKLSYDDEFITIAEGRGLGEQAKAVAERIRADRAARTGEPNDLRSVGQINRGVDETSSPQESPVRLSAPVPFQGNVTPGFNPTVYTAADRRQTTAFTRVLNDPEYQGIRNALGGKQYISYTVDETLSKAEEFLNLPVHNGDLKTAFYAAGNATGITAEQVVMTKALAIQRAQKAANNARTSSGDTALPAHTRNSMDTLARHYQDLADEFADDLMSQASLAGQELRAFRMLADTLSPYSWVRKYKQPIVHTQKLKMDADPVFKEMLERIKAARRDAANSTTTRMQKALAIAAKRFVKDTSVEEMGAYEKFARLLASNLSVREEVMQAATEMAVVSGMEAIRKAVAPDEKVDPAFLKQWEDKLRSIASEQLNGIIESRLQGGMVDPEASPELTEEQKMAAREQKIMDAWRDFSDFPLAEMVFNLARSTIVASDSPYAALVRKAQFDPAKIKRLQQAVKMSINTAEEIRKSVADRNMSVESLILRLQETNPSLSETEVGALAEAVKAVYDDEVQRASAAALQTIVNSSKRDPRKLTDAATISKLLPLVNMGAFKEEEVYNVLAEKFGLPTWSQENAEKIEAMANRVQALPEGSIERGETGQQMMLEILRANIKDSRGATRLQHMNQIASAVWTAGILSGPPTQIVNAAGTGLSVFLESFMDATGHFIEAKKRGVSTAQASEYYKDIARAWLFAFGKDANNTSLRAFNEVHTALTRGASKFKSEKQEDLSTLELFKFDPKMAIPGNALMEAITTGEWKQVLPQAGDLGLGILKTAAERVVNRDAKGALKDYLATLKMVGRGMLATDAVNSFAATAAKEMMIKRTLMQTEGLTDAEVNRQMKEIRKGGEEAVVDAAKAQAEQEAAEGSFGPVGSSDHSIRKARRVEQLIEQMTYGNSVMEQGRDFAANVTFNSEAYGIIGATMMTVFGNMNRYAGVAAKPINPFPKTVSNLLNTSLNYTLYGYARAMGWNMGSRWINQESKYFRAAPDRGSAEFYAAHAKATAGTLALGALAMMLAQALKDREEKKEPFFEVHGPGPKDPKLRAQWAQSGHKPFTVRIGGLELRYTDWPGINIPLGMLGTVYDNLTHTNKEADWVDQLFIGVSSVLGTTLDRNMLGGATALFDLMSKNTYDGAKEAALGKLVSSYTGGFLKPSFVRYLETVATGGYQDARSVRGWFLSQIPVVGALANNPAINVLGEPIKVSAWDATAGRLVSLSDTHPILSPLTTADLVVPKPEAYKIYDPSKPTMVRPMSAQEEYEYAATYGKIMKERLTPELVQSLTEQAKFAPQGAQDVLTNIATGVRNQAQGELAAKRQIQKGKELKGP